jgi:hypothetical protein
MAPPAEIEGPILLVLNRVHPRRGLRGFAHSSARGFPTSPNPLSERGTAIEGQAGCCYASDMRVLGVALAVVVMFFGVFFITDRFYPTPVYLLPCASIDYCN